MHDWVNTRPGSSRVLAIVVFFLVFLSENKPRHCVDEDWHMEGVGHRGGVICKRFFQAFARARVDPGDQHRP